MARKFRQPTGRLCDCGSGLPVLTHSRLCYACEVHNAWVAAQKAFAVKLASIRLRANTGDGAWVNQYGCFGCDEKEIGIDVASSDEVAPLEGVITQLRNAACKHWKAVSDGTR